MKRLICRAAIFAAFGIVAANMTALQSKAAGSTQLGYSKTDGYHVTGKITDKWGAHDATPTVQQTGTDQTAFAVLATKGIIAPAATDYSVQHRTVLVSAAEIIAMYTTPKLLVAAQGSGKSIAVTRMIFKITRTSTAFTGGAAAIVQYDSTANGAGTQALDSTIASTVITGSAGTTITTRNGAVISDAAATVTQNKGLYLSNGTAVFAAGTGTVTLDIWYVVQ